MSLKIYGKGLKCECGQELDGVTAADGNDAAPKEGDVSVCMYCFRFLRFSVHAEDGLCVNGLTDEEFACLPFVTRMTLRESREVAKMLAERRRNIN